MKMTGKVTCSEVYLTVLKEACELGLTLDLMILTL